MPGITGILRQSPRDGANHDLEVMLESMQHEPHYRSGRYADPDLGLYVGWTTHQNSLSDCMPVVSHDKNVVLIFHGEHYEAGHELGQQQPDGGRNAQHLLDLYAQHGDGFLRCLNGWYSGIVADRRTRKIILFNDRYGMGRIYFHEAEDEFIFASEAKCLLAVRPVLRAIEPENLSEYLRFNCVTRNKTLFRGISLVPNAASWQFHQSTTPRKRHYFDFAEWEQQPELAPSRFYESFATTLTRVIPAYAKGTDKVALSLTAGLDTRAILAALQTHGPRLPSYTFDGPEGELFDVSIARRLSKLHNVHFETIRADASFLKDFPKFAERSVYISDGTHDAFGAHDIYLNDVARHIAPVRLTGKFGSEVVRVRRLISTYTYRDDYLGPDLRSLIRALPPLSRIFQQRHALTQVVSEEIPWHESGRVSIEQSQLILRTPYMDNELVKLMFQAPSGVRTKGDLQDQYIRAMSPELASIPTNLGRFLSHNRLLTKLAYAPFWALFKLEYVYLYATPHWLTRIDRGLGKWRLERILSGRQKWEAYRIWAKTHFADFIRETLSSPRARYTEFFQKEIVQNMLTRHLAGTHNYLNEINRALTVELIYSSLLSVRPR